MRSAGNGNFEALAKLYGAHKTAKELVSVLTELAAREPESIPIRLQLAKLHREADRQADAEQWARETLSLMCRTRKRGRFSLPR